jgi:hypothetical protein
MGFLSGRISFESFRIGGASPRQFGPPHIKTLEQFAIGQTETSSAEEAAAGFVGGEHLFDGDFNLEKNVIGQTLHCAVRIDTNVIPAAVRKAWLQMELAALGADTPSGRPTKTQRQEAKDAVAARCEEEARSGKFRRMQQFPVLWDAKGGILYVGSSSSTSIELCLNLFERAFDLEFERLSAGKRAQQWAAEFKKRKALDDVSPAPFQGSGTTADIAWWNNESGNFDFLGNEFLLWLWWHWETQSETLALPDGSEVTGMFARTLALQCPLGETGKETITAEGPTQLPEAAHAIRSGKLPRKAGLILVRHDEQYELVLQAETFAVSGAQIRSQETTEEGAEKHLIQEERIEGLRNLNETVDLLFRAFCQQRIGTNWSGEFERLRRWLKLAPKIRKER